MDVSGKARRRRDFFFSKARRSRDFFFSKASHRRDFLFKSMSQSRLFFKKRLIAFGAFICQKCAIEVTINSTSLKLILLMIAALGRCAMCNIPYYMRNFLIFVGVG